MTTLNETMDAVTKRSSEPQPQAGIRLTEQQLRARRARSVAIALALGAFVAVIFLVTLVKLGSGVPPRPM
jgi:hypothetical protein